MSRETNHPIDKVRQLQRKLYVQAKKCPTRRFHALYERIHDWEVLKESWKRVRQKQGSSGVDEVTIKAIEAQGVEVTSEAAMPQGSLFRSRSIFGSGLYSSSTADEDTPDPIDTERVAMTGTVILESTVLSE